MADPSGLFLGVQRHGPITLAPVLEFGFGSESDIEDPPTVPSLDFFHRRRAPAVFPDHDPGFLNLGLGLGFTGQEDQDWVRHCQLEQEHEEALELGLGYPGQEDHDWLRHQQQEHGEAFEDWASDEFFIGLRSAGRGNEFSDTLNPSLESDSVTDNSEQIVTIGSDPDPGLPLCLDCVQIDDPPPAAAEEFEWEEIDGTTDIISTVIRDDDFQEDISFEMGGIVEEVTDVARSVIEWEVLHHLDTDTDAYYMDDGFEDDFIFTSGYNFGQFQDLKGGRPAAKSIVESLPTVVLKTEEVNCVVCKDEILAYEKAKKLPCCHYYHEVCILRWLGMRSTCPLCRYELPTDDAEYEKRKARRADSNRGEGQV